MQRTRDALGDRAGCALTQAGRETILIYLHKWYQKAVHQLRSLTVMLAPSVPSEGWPCRSWYVCAFFEIWKKEIDVIEEKSVEKTTFFDKTLKQNLTQILIFHTFKMTQKTCFFQLTRFLVDVKAEKRKNMLFSGRLRPASVEKFVLCGKVAYF